MPVSPAASKKNGIGWYNGWSGEERLAVLPVIRAALAEGRMAQPTRCSVCLVYGSSHAGAADAIVFHDEDYSRPLEAYPICRNCHRLVHMRFWRAREWAAHLAE